MYQIIKRAKTALYFPVAAYFRFWARIRLQRWRPKIIVITGSTGKTFLLSLFSHQLGNKACYTFGANSAFGIPFYLLNMRRKSYSVFEWLLFFFQAPFSAWKKIPSQKLLFVEADCDRTGEGKFLASFLHPDITLWQNVSLSHSGNFFPGSLESIAYEFGYFLKYTKNYVLVNEDSQAIEKQLSRTAAKIIGFKKNDLRKYEVSLKGTDFVTAEMICHLDYILPKDSFYALKMLYQTMSLLGQAMRKDFSALRLEPGRNTIFKGIRETTIVDSTYNSNLSSTQAMIETFNVLSAPKKWLIVGDMVDLGENEEKEHGRLAEILQKSDFEKLILVGKRNLAYTLPQLKNKDVVAFSRPRQGLEYLLKNLSGKELILIKGAGFLEVIVETLLKDPEDKRYLCRREKVWEERRKKFYL
ncbi:hypothetical protein HY345_00055 [Candidatus Microgenomates bacterium]|nr:hypothetical protein [Candidatus Microgenomates bacterium]